MKQIILLAVLLMIFACRKSSNSTSEEDTTILKAKEFGTGTPLSGVSVLLLRCSKYDAVFGCQATALVAIYTTAANGECKVKNDDYYRADEGILYKKAQYWDTENGGLMEPEAFADVTFKAGKAYPDTLELLLTTRSQTGIISKTLFKAPQDSLVNFRVFGNEQNDIDWVLYPQSNCTFFCVVDTVAKGKFTVQPKNLKL